MLTFCYARHIPRNGYFCPTVVIHLGLEESCMFLTVLLIKSYYFCHHSSREIYTDPCWPVIWHVMGNTAGNQFCLRQLMKSSDTTQQFWTWIDNLGWVTVWNIEWCKTRINVSVKMQEPCMSLEYDCRHLILSLWLKWLMKQMIKEYMATSSY